jgi:hypothetical protein
MLYPGDAQLMTTMTRSNASTKAPISQFASRELPPVHPLPTRPDFFPHTVMPSLRRVFVPRPSIVFAAPVRQATSLRAEVETTALRPSSAKSPSGSTK